MMWNVLIGAVLNYLKKHPEQIEQLIGQLIQMGIHELIASNATAESGAGAFPRAPSANV